MASMKEPRSLPFDNQSFDYQEPVPSSSNRKRPLPAPQPENLFAKAHKASIEAGLVPLEAQADCKVLPSGEFEKVKQAQMWGYLKKSCNYPGHMSTQGCHKKLFYQSFDHERVAIRRILDSRVNVTSFERSIRAQYFDLRCYNYAEIIIACFPALDYRKRWIILEENSVGQRFIQHRQLTEETKAGVKMVLSRSESYAGVKNKLIRTRVMPSLRHLAIYDILMSVYGSDFYTKNDVLKQCGPIADLAERMADRYRCREKALISPITSMIPLTDCKLTVEQKYVVIGLLHQETDVNKVREDLARLFPESFSSRSTIDVLDATFGSYRDTCIVTKATEMDPEVGVSYHYKTDTIILDEKFSCVSVLKALKEQQTQESGKEGEKSKKKPKLHYKQKKSNGQVMIVRNPFTKPKGSVI